LYPHNFLLAFQPVIMRFGMLLVGLMANIRARVVVFLGVEVYYHFRYEWRSRGSGATKDSSLAAICVFVGIVATFSYYQREKIQQYKQECDQNVQMLKEKSEKLTVKNKFIATLTHEIRNFVTK
jgi:hypothetical protein